jgi:hypothetical protein
MKRADDADGKVAAPRPGVEPSSPAACVASLPNQVAKPRRRLVAPQQHAGRTRRDSLGEHAEVGVAHYDCTLALFGTGGLRAVAPQRPLDVGEGSGNGVECRRLAGRRRADQRLPQHQWFRPRWLHAHSHARSSERGHSCQ